jgi:hypothetical protein
MKNQDPSASVKITLVVTPDTKRELERWAQENRTSMSAETVRAVRFCARAERASVAVD